MKCVILQPSYIPWRGYFHQIYEADVFVFYDDVQYDRRGWRNRNRIKTPQGTRWLTIPVLSKGTRTNRTPINQVRICWDNDWSANHWNTLLHAYSKAPFFSKYESLLVDFYSQRPALLCDFVIETTKALARTLGIRDTRFIRSSTLTTTGTKTNRLLQILKALEADRYITGPSARDYLDEQLLNEEGINVEYMAYDYPEYPQLFPPFDGRVSILDLLFVAGSEAPRYIWETKELNK